jgi:hypothetical protein
MDLLDPFEDLVGEKGGLGPTDDVDVSLVEYGLDAGGEGVQRL